jgi:hypothetical protein
MAMARKIEAVLPGVKPDYRNARGCAPRQPGAPLAEDVIRKMREGEDSPTNQDSG